jgi:hypothetical protein
MIFMATASHAAGLGVTPIPSGFSGDTSAGDNSAFFEGDSLSYVLSAPPECRLVIDEVAEQGYSLAFIPEGRPFDSAQMMIAVSILSNPDGGKTLPLADFILTDTAAVTRHYGPGMAVSRVALTDKIDDKGIVSFYLNDKTRFVPDVLLSYFSGGSEILVFQLSIREGFPRFEAEKAFVECLSKFRILIKGSVTEFNADQ